MSSIALDGAMASPVSPKLPFPPMEAELVDELPEPDGWQYEPKWDGFRGILENVTGELHLWSRNGRPLLRYFPELEALGKKLKPNSAVDGEIVIARDGALDFDALQMRLHPAESRVQQALGGDPRGLRRFRPPPLGWRGNPRASARGAPQARREAAALGLAGDARPQGGPGLARPARGGGVRRRHRQAHRPPLPAWLARRRRQGEGREDRRLRRHRRHLEREGIRDREPHARALRREEAASRSAPPRRPASAARRSSSASSRSWARTRSASRAASRAAGARR